MSACQPKTYNVTTFKTQGGWGYTIQQENKIIIKQSIIPVVSQIQNFQNEKEALKTANLVVDKLNHKLSPSLTKKDLILLEIKLR